MPNHIVSLSGKPVHCWPDMVRPSAFLTADDSPSIILNHSNHKLGNVDIGEWDTALKLHAQWLSQCLHPEYTNTRWLDLVKASFESKVLTPLTSYIVVENESQKALLQNKQTKVLNGNRNLDLNGDVRQMSEPRVWLFLLLFSLFILCKKRYMLQRNCTISRFKR